jgi:hypothetical protein
MRVMDELSGEELSGEELAVRSGVTAEQLQRLVELGIITSSPQGRFRPPTSVGAGRLRARRDVAVGHAQAAW